MFGFVLPTKFYPCSNLTSNHIFQIAWNHHLLEVIYVYDSPNMMMMMMMMMMVMVMVMVMMVMVIICRTKHMFLPMLIILSWANDVSLLFRQFVVVDLLVGKFLSLLQVVPKRWRQRLALRVRSEGWSWTSGGWSYRVFFAILQGWVPKNQLPVELYGCFRK